MVTQIELATDRPAWERQDAETDAQFRAFTAYVDLGRFRTLDKLAAVLKGQKTGEDDRRKTAVGGHLNDWSRANRWVERARSWDLHLYDIKRQEQVHQAKLDMIEASDHARKIREDARIDYDLFVMHIRAHLLPAFMDDQGEPSKAAQGISAKDLRELAQARDRLKELARDVFFGLEQSSRDDSSNLDQLDPDLADLIAKVMSEHGKSARSDA